MESSALFDQHTFLLSIVRPEVIAALKIRANSFAQIGVFACRESLRLAYRIPLENMETSDLHSVAIFLLP